MTPDPDALLSSDDPSISIVFTSCKAFLLASLCSTGSASSVFSNWANDDDLEYVSGPPTNFCGGGFLEPELIFLISLTV